MKTRQTKRTAERPERKALVITLRIPAEIVPLFECCQSIMRVKSPQEMAEWLILKGLTSEIIMERFDKMVNRLL